MAQAVAEHRPELVLHCAAWTDVDGAESDPEGAWRANEYGSRHVARAARAAGAALVGFSTDYVFAGDDPEGYDERSPVAPRSVYGASKLAGERALLAEHPEAYVVRTAWIYSPRGRNFLLTMLRLGAERDELRVVDDQVGCPTAALHLAQATLELVARCAPGTYHLAGGGSTSWHGFAAAIMQEAGLSARVEPITSSELQRPAPQAGLLDPANRPHRRSTAATLAGRAARLSRRPGERGGNVRRILVTGGCGFIGSHFVRRLLRRHDDVEVVNLDALTYAGNPANLADVAGSERYRFVHGSICDADAVASAAEGCDAIVNFAAETHVDRSIMEAGRVHPDRRLRHLSPARVDPRSRRPPRARLDR